MVAAAKKAPARRRTDAGAATPAAAPPGRRKASLAGEEAPVASSYFSRVGDKSGLVFVSSGCAGIDAALGGGYPYGRCVNVVGDKSSGKTLSAIEILANHHATYPKGPMRYAEAEAAFDKGYARAIGMPVDAIEFTGDGIAKVKKGEEEKSDRIDTIETFYADLLDFLDRKKGMGPMVYVLDSLDALSDAAELGREITDGSYGGNKAKKMGELFRRLVQPLEDAQCLLVVISQLRDKLNVTFGEKQTRSGGRALDFYATHIVWLAELGKITKEIDGVKRVIGVDVKARVKKNKVGLAYREFEYPILYGYGIDDLTANAEWLVSVKAEERLKNVGLSKAGYKIRIANLRNKGGEEARELRRGLRAELFAEWTSIEEKFLPKASKY